MAEGFTFGTKVAADVRVSDGSTQWIRGFKNGSTQIRIAPAEAKDAQGHVVYGYQAWPSEWEHYDKELQVSYPCMRDHGGEDPEGTGCLSPNKATRDRSRKYYVNALDVDGNLRIFKFGAVIWKALKRRQDRMVADHPENKQPLSDRDFIIHRSGSGMQGTEYEVENAEVYDVDFPEELHDIPAALQAQWQEAMDKYNGNEPLGDGEDDDVEEEPPAPRRIGQQSKEVEEEVERPAAKKAAPAAKKAAPAAKKTAAAAKKTAAAAPAEPEDDGDIDSTLARLDDMEIAALRQWVGDHVPDGYEVPAGAPRSKLMKIAENVLKGDEPPF